MNLQSALAYLYGRTNPAEQARLDYLLHNTPPAPAAVEQLLNGQRPDGGWSPFWAADYSSIDATCYRLAQADQMGLSPSQPALGRALAFLAYRQHADGSWQEEAAVADQAPPWAKPGNDAATLYLTANSGFWLAVLAGSKDGPQAADYLQTYLDTEGRLPSFLHTHWLAAALWHNVGRHDTAECVLTYLSGQLAQLTPANLAWLILSLRRAGLPTDHPLLSAAATLLAQQQQPDGHWPADDGPAWDVHTTLEALRALHDYTSAATP
jgi:hypothetical protein